MISDILFVFVWLLTLYCQSHVHTHGNFRRRRRRGLGCTALAASNTESFQNRHNSYRPRCASKASCFFLGSFLYAVLVLFVASRHGPHTAPDRCCACRPKSCFDAIRHIFCAKNNQSHPQTRRQHTGRFYLQRIFLRSFNRTAMGIRLFPSSNRWSLKEEPRRPSLRRFR
jgi:hypothetical protein